MQWTNRFNGAPPRVLDEARVEGCADCGRFGRWAGWKAIRGEQDMTRIGTEVGLLTGRLRRRFLNGKEKVAHARSAASESTKRAARETDYYVHENAWTMMAVTAGLAFMAGFLLSRRNQEAISAGVRSDGSEEVERKVKTLNTWEFIHSAVPLGLFLWKAVQASRCARKGAI